MKEKEEEGKEKGKWRMRRNRRWGEGKRRRGGGGGKREPEALANSAVPQNSGFPLFCRQPSQTVIPTANITCIEKNI